MALMDSPLSLRERAGERDAGCGSVPCPFHTKFYGRR
jgi:hypothetical protein